jgi:hypothetical protein
MLSQNFRLYLPLPMILVCGLFASAQDSVVKSQYKILIQKIDSLSHKDDEQPIGIFRLNPDPVSHHFKQGKEDFKTSLGIKIDSVTIQIKDGYILDVHAYSGDKQFTNQFSPIALNARRLDKTRDFLANPRDDNEGIIFQEILLHDSLTSYYPEDGFYKFTPAVNKLVLYRKTGVNTILDLRLYTDALGLFGKEPNGVIQTDARLKQFLSRSNGNNGGVFWTEYMRLNFNASKMTNMGKYVDSAHFSRTSLLQSSFLNADVALNIVNGWLEFKSLNFWYVDGGAGVSEVNLARGADTSIILTTNIFAEAGVDLKPSDNVGFTGYFRCIDQFSPQTDWNKNNLGHLFGRFGAEVFWNPFDNKANRVFARMNYTFATSKNDTKNSFFQLQFGYSVLLSSLVGH